MTLKQSHIYEGSTKSMDSSVDMEKKWLNIVLVAGSKSMIMQSFASIAEKKLILQI